MLDYFHASDRQAALAALINLQESFHEMYRIFTDSITERRRICNYVLVFVAQIREEGRFYACAQTQRCYVSQHHLAAWHSVYPIEFHTLSVTVCVSLRGGIQTDLHVDLFHLSYIFIWPTKSFLCSQFIWTFYCITVTNKYLLCYLFVLVHWFHHYIPERQSKHFLTVEFFIFLISAIIVL